ncbi:Imm52 family immunity protein [Ralstonia soli]|uniref:Immunity 52 family protein n=1 Tax=Ralstonia soli TaxID=2953896 RepID=A0ABT1AQX7_9RALS|nr:Imm52 family immunity protein [Ralstonia soli]MCO5400874.1 immunity 52 family protein [Ralstonia soli]
MKFRNYEVGCVWGDRLQSAGECAAQMRNFVGAVREVVPELSWYYEDYRSRSFDFPDDVSEINKKIISPVNGDRKGVPLDRVYPEVGFSALIFSAKNNCAAIRAGLGCAGEDAFNSVVIHFPEKGPIAEAILNAATLERLFVATIRCWRPDWAWIDYTDINDKDRSMPPVYWFVYGNKPKESVPSLPAPAEVHAIDSLGTYIVTTRELYDRTIPTHRDTSEAVKQRLRDANWLPPPVG